MQNGDKTAARATGQRKHSDGTAAKNTAGSPPPHDRRRVLVRRSPSTIRLAIHKVTQFSPVKAWRPLPLEAEAQSARLTDEQIARLRDEGAEVFEDFQFKLFDDFPFDPMFEWWDRPLDAVMPMMAEWKSKSQEQVMKHIKAPAAWTVSKGAGVTIAVVDTGVDGSARDFASKSKHSFMRNSGDPWDDAHGHGSMCASVACSSKSAGGKYDGVAPEATLLACATDFGAVDLYDIYVHLITKKREGAFPGGLVVSNSFGHESCTAPQFPNGHPYVDLIRAGVNQGIVFVFAAGNNHGVGVCGNDAGADAPNTIWSVNSIDEVICVGTVDWEDSNRNAANDHHNSSRGPGDWSKRKDKPDVVAPTYGEVRWGAGYRKMPWWGTSGACPQVAGLAALLLAKAPSITPAQVLQIIRNSARLPGNAPANCAGAGIIDCAQALKLV